MLQSLRDLFERNPMPHWRSMVRRIDGQSSVREKLTDAEMRKTSLSLRYQALSGTPLDELLIDAFSLVREASRRAVGMRHYDVQLLGGIAMHHESIAVMQTGEGKTLTATLPIYLAALLGKGAHLSTANDYLAERDAQLMRPVYEMLGLSVGVVQANSTREQRRDAYACDVTYTTAKEIGFDFLRDRLQTRRREQASGSLMASLLGDSVNATVDQPVHRGFQFLLVDEADSILIDEARTPLIVSSVPDGVALASIELYKWSAKVGVEFVEGKHYKSDPKSRNVTLTGAGRQLVRTLPKPDLLAETVVTDIYEQIEQAVFVQNNYFLDRHYVLQNNEVVIVDEFTGRLAEGRKWRAGLHQAIEAREGLQVSVETGEAARITIQELFLRYQRIAGMTGTAANSAAELKKIYQLRVVDVPTNKPPRRNRWDDLVFGSEVQKWAAIVDEVAKVHQTGRPVLVGTRTIDKSEKLSKLLAERGIAHEVLNARHLEQEASIIAQAGVVGRVTVATNMAGRGTDIRLDDSALNLGGLHVICSELHESARIDRQLIGRCGRQGDPGTYRQFMSLDDDILRLGLGQKTFERLAKYANQSSASLKRLASMFRQAQRRIERRHFQSRKMLMYQEQQRHELQIEMGQDPYLDVAGAA